MIEWLTIIGVGEAGVAELPPALRATVERAQTVIGPARHIDSIGEAGAQKRVAWQPSLDVMLAQLLTLRGTPTVMLASGDPMWFGFGATLSKHIVVEEFAVHPHPSSFSLAASRLRWPLQHVATISLHARPVEGLARHLAPGGRILALTSDRTTIDAALSILKSRGYKRSQVTVLENLGGPRERVTSEVAEDFDAANLGDFHVLAIDCVAEVGFALSTVPGLPDEAFQSDGQLTKRDIRAATLAKLAPVPGALLWDVGAGSGSVGIEWMRAARDASAIAIERDPERLAMIKANASTLGVPELRIVAGEAPESFVGLPAPDALFLGGGVGDEPLFQACWRVLKPGGRLVANAVTLDGEQAIYARQARLGGEIVRIEVSVLDTVGSHRVLRPRMAVTQWSVSKP